MIKSNVRNDFCNHILLILVKWRLYPAIILIYNDSHIPAGVSETFTLVSWLTKNEI